MAKKLLFILLGTLVLLGLLCGCSKKDSGTASKVTAPPTGQVTRPECYQDIYGVYAGRLDVSSIRIIVEEGQALPGGGEATFFLLPADQNEEVANFKANDRIKFNCYKNSSNQWQITTIEKEKGAGGFAGVPALDEGDFAVEFKQRSVKLGDWERYLDLQGIFGQALSAETVRLGTDAGALAGSYVKRLVYDGVELGLISPGNNGKSFYLDTAYITGGAWATARGVMVGDSYTKILELYPGKSGEERAREDPRNRFYSYSKVDAGDMLLNFEVRDGIVKSITLQIEHPC